MSMKKSLVLGILEGRDWNPVEGHKTVIEAHLDNHKLSTNVFPLTNSPKFNTEVTWEADKQIIRSYKLNRVPIKIICYALDEKNNRKLLGYIVLPLTSAVEGVEGDSKWYRLLGGPKGTYKTPPSILLRLHMEAMTLDQHSQMNGKERSGKNGSRSIENCHISSVLEKKNKYLQQVNLKADDAQTNGNSEDQQFIEYPLQNSFHMNASNGKLVENNVEGENQIDSDTMEEGEVEEEELLDSEEEYLEDEDEALGTIVSVYSLNKYENENNSGSNSDREAPVSLNNGGQPITVQTSSVDVNNTKTEVRTVNSNKDISSQNSRSVPIKDPDEIDQFLKSRTSVKDHLKKVSESLQSSNREKQTFESSSLIRRLSDTSSLFDISFERKNKSRKLDESPEISHFDSLQKPEKVSQEENLDEIKSRLSQNKDATCVGILLSQSIGETSNSKQKDFSSEACWSKGKEIPSNRIYPSNTKLIPKLNPEEGYFYIGSEDGEYEEFLFSVSIIYAKNLSKIISENASPSMNEGYRFCYSLLGYPIYTDSFSNLDDPEFVAEKASAKIRSSHNSLSRYFGQHPFLPVYFLNGEDALGVCNIDIGFLMDVATKNKVHFQDVFQINPMDDSAVLNQKDSIHKPVVAIAFEISKSFDINFKFPNASEKHLKANYNEVYVSDSASSNSEHDEDYKHKAKSKKNKRRYSLKNYLHEEKALNAEKSFEREKKSMLLEAAYEIEQWKEEKRSLFLKDWSAKEETFQRLLATEWSSKVKLIEEELSQRISLCDQLQEKLNKGLAELSVREGKCKLKENQVKRLEENCNAEKERSHLLKLKENLQGTEASVAKDIFTKQLQLEKSKNEHLEEEVRRLKEELRSTNENLNIQTQEIIDLRRKLVLTDDLIGASREKEILQNKVDHIQDRKQYYKAQWLSTLTDLHKLHSAHKRIVDEITCDAKILQSEDQQPTTSSQSSSIGIKLKKLKDERRILLESGFYSSNHSIIKNIDKKIKELIG